MKYQLQYNMLPILKYPRIIGKEVYDQVGQNFFISCYANSVSAQMDKTDSSCVLSLRAFGSGPLCRPSERRHLFILIKRIFFLIIGVNYNESPSLIKVFHVLILIKVFHVLIQSIIPNCYFLIWYGTTTIVRESGRLC